MSFFTGSATVQLVTVTCWCGTPHAIPKEMYNHQERQHRDGEKQMGIYCPHGHSWINSGEGEAARLRKQLVQEQHRANTLAEKNAANAVALARSEAAAKRLKKRAAAGVCPCCNRTVSQMARHMKAKHPEFVAGKDAA